MSLVPNEEEKENLNKGSLILINRLQYVTELSKRESDNLSN